MHKKNSNQKHILITGASGQLGYELQETVPNNYTLFACDADVLDITNLSQARKIIEQQKPAIIINAAAYTAVDKAEEEVDLAWQVNHIGAENLAKISHENKIQLVQISTDFIFDGKQSQPYLADDYQSQPESVYGQSKLAGEKSVLRYAPDNHLIIRTAWLYSAHGNNFVKSMLNFMQSRESLGIVADQIGTPTWAKTLANTTWQLIKQLLITDKSRTKNNTKNNMIYHCSDNGIASWYDFAIAIQSLALQQGLLNKKIPIKAIRTQDYPTAASRPQYSVMDKTQTELTLDKQLPHWQTSLAKMLMELG
jgi:dTDP-4-dehydrorhamnose reductase